MASQLIRYGAIRVADNVSDQLDAATIAAIGANAVTQEDFQEALLSQIRRILSGDAAGAWNQDFVGAGLRSLKDLDQSVSAVDRVIVRPRRTQVQAAIPVPVGQNFVVLSAAAGQTPTPPCSLSPTVEGAVAVRLDAGEFGANRLTAPNEDGIRMLVDIVDAATGAPINDAVRDQPIRAILQLKDTGVEGQPVDDGANQAQLSFVVSNPGTFALEAADAGGIGGKSILYAFAQRQRLSAIPTAGFLIDGVGFVDGAAGVEVTRQRAYDLGPTVDVRAGSPHRTDLAQDGAEVAWRVAGVNALRLLRNDAEGALLEATVARLNVANTQPATMQKGLRVDVADGSIDLGVVAGKIARPVGDLVVETPSGSLALTASGGELGFSDSRVAVPIPFSSAGQAAFLGALAGSPSVLAAINKAATIGGVDMRLGIKQYTSGKSARQNVSGGGFFDFTVPGLVFFDETNVPSTRNVFIFFNGVLERNGEPGDPNDVRLGSNPANGDLIFGHRIESGDVIVALSLIQ